MIEDIPIWVVPCNWSDNITDTLSWLTSLTVTPMGFEQRRACRLSPRRSLEFSVLADSFDRARIDTFMAQIGTQPFYAPFWPGVTQLRDDLPHNQDYALIDADNYEFTTARPAMIFDGTTNYELVEIASVSKQRLDFTKRVSSSRTAGTHIYPLAKFRFSDKIQYSRRTSKIMTGTIRYDFVGANDLIGTPDFYYNWLIRDDGGWNREYGFSWGGHRGQALPSDVGGWSFDWGYSWGESRRALFPVYEGYAVWTARADYANDSDIGYERMASVLDNNTGLPFYVDVALQTFFSQNCNYTLSGVDSHLEFMKLLYGASGRFRSIWIPSGFRDLEIYADIPRGSTVKVYGCDYTLNGGPGPGKKVIAIWLNDGTLYVTKVLSSVAVGEYEQLTVGPSLPAIPAADIMKIEFLRLSRLDQDTISVNHLTSLAGTAQVQLTFKSIRQPD